jgi:peptide/nickel transport system substrate-binding protein
LANASHRTTRPRISDDAPQNNAPPIASGAFKFKEWVPGDHVTLSRNDNYWNNANIDEWVHKTYPSGDALTAALKVGEVDMAQFDPKDLADMQNVSSVNVFKYLHLGYTYIGWNQLRWYDTSGLNDYKFDPAKAEQLLQQDGW